ENMLEVQDRKSRGAFYTPREIVHYMCQESLIHYLDTALNMVEAGLAPEEPSQGQLFGDPPPKQQALTVPQRRESVPREEIAALVRRGALALQQDAAKEAGLLNGDYVLPASVRRHAAKLDAALAEIKLCDPAIGSGAFPVGMLHEIVQARLALDTQLKSGRTPYALKRHAIQQSIYGVDIDGGAVEIAKLRLWLSLVVDEESYADIQPLPNLDYKIVQGNSLGQVKKNLFNMALFTDLDALKRRYFDETHPTEKTKLRAQIEQLIGLLTNGMQEFDFDVYFHEVFEGRGGFDVMIGNPPYVRMGLIKDKKPLLKQLYPDVYGGRVDLYVYFYRRSLEILADFGVLAFISSNKFMRAKYGTGLRAFLAGQTTLQTLIDFGDLSVFDATAYPCIVIAQKEAPQPEDALLALTVNSLDVLQNLPLVVDDLAWPLQQQSLRAEGWALVRSQVQALMAKLRRERTPLSEFVNGKFYRGVVTGFNQAFVIDEATRQQLIAADPRSAEVIKPWLRGRDIKRWRVDWQNLYVIFTYHGIDISSYPAVLEYLWPFRKRLEQRATSNNHQWYELQQPQMGCYREFEKPKITSTDIAKRCEFTLDESGTYIDATLFCIPIADLYLLGVLNSPVVEFYYRTISSTIRGDYLRFKRIYMYTIPVPDKPSSEELRTFEGLVQKLLHVQGQGSQVAKWEQELNETVYRLYDLTAEEIALIEAGKEAKDGQE
ncbi:MAG: TaqI-like C-terminal specificity domain-containing protein, partial [Anaerolineae bacterium]